MFQPFRSFLALLVAVILLCGQLPVGVMSDELSADHSVPATSVPEVSVPESSVPESSAPEASSPESSPPESSAPESSTPESSAPETSAPESSAPEASAPESSTPESSAPESSAPETSVPESSAPETSVPETSTAVILSDDTETPAGPGLYFGLLHAHTAISDGTGTPAEAFSWASQVEGLDFFAITDHSHSFDQQESGQIGVDAAVISQDWAAGKAAAAEISSRDFVAIFGYEMSWPANMQIGHISTFNTPGFQSWKQAPYHSFHTALGNYYQALTSVPGSIGMFNHPGSQYGYFSDFDYTPEADRAMNLIELGSAGQNPLASYLQALDLGWHVAPVNHLDGHGPQWGTATSSRTVVNAQELTEEGIYEAIRNNRVYATEDSDLEILYTMDGYPMGSQLKLRQVGETADLVIRLADPTDSALGLVEVVTNGGQSIAQGTLSASFGTLCFSLRPESGYYFLRVTQPDGDIAVTAPIWLDAEESLGIAGLTCETATPVQNEPVSLTLSLYNRESVDFLVDSLEFFAGEKFIFQEDLRKIGAGTSFALPISLNCDSVGITRIRVVLTGTLDGSPRTYESELELRFQQSDQITAILVDGSHGNAGLDQLSRLRQMALEAQTGFTVIQEEATTEILKDARFFLVCAPSRPFSQSFLEAVSEYAQHGGSLVICGQSSSSNTGFCNAAELNRLLSAIGSTMEIRDDAAQDRSNHGGQPDLLYPEAINTALSWLQNISQGQTFRCHHSATVSPGQGTWMVKGFSTTGPVYTPGEAPVLLACESLSGGGTVFAAGSLFLADSCLEAPANIWDAPYVNRAFANSLLGIGGPSVPLSTVQQARTGSKNEPFRIQGYVTAGTTNAHNSFKNTIYVQDDTGGIAVTPISGAALQQGTPVEILGYADSQDGNPILRASSWTVLNRQMHQTMPLQGHWSDLLDLQAHGGSLVQVEGTCQEIYCREDNTFSGCLLKDQAGNTIKIRVEDHIGNCSDGKNELQNSVCKGRTVRAIGLLHKDAYGQTVIRVRNCEEVVYIPPRIGPYINPKTGDFLPVALTGAASSMLALLALFKRKTSG